MQPLNTSARPSSGSIRGWAPRSDRSMIFSRRWARAMLPEDQLPPASGPRDCMVPAMRSTAATSGGRSHASSPARPHISRRERGKSRSDVTRTSCFYSPATCPWTSVLALTSSLSQMTSLGGSGHARGSRGRGDESAEQLDVIRKSDKRLGVPLHGDQEREIRVIDSLDRAVRCPRAGAESLAQLVNRLMVEGVDLELGRPQQL